MGDQTRQFPLLSQAAIPNTAVVVFRTPVLTKVGRSAWRLGPIVNRVPTNHNRQASLSKSQARALREYERILEVTGLNLERVLEFAESEPEAVVPVFKSMTDQAVRSDVIFEYTMIDAELEFIVLRHFFGSGKKLKVARRTQRYKTLRLMLQNIYLLQKLSIVRSFREIPKPIVSSIAAINNLRNGLAHTFFVSDLSAPKRTYKGHNIFTRKGLEVFRKDVQEIRYFFMSWLKKLLEEEWGHVA